MLAVSLAPLCVPQLPRHSVGLLATSDTTDETAYKQYTGSPHKQQHSFSQQLSRMSQPVGLALTVLVVSRLVAIN